MESESCQPQLKVVGDIQWSDLDKTRLLAFGSLFMLSTRAVVYPAYLIKTKLQLAPATANVPAVTAATASAAHVHVKEANTRSLFQHIVKTEGPGGLYRGFWVVMAGILPSQTVYYATYEWLRERAIEFCDRFDRREYMFQDPSGIQAASVNELSRVRSWLGSSIGKDATSNFIAGSFSSLASQAIVIPVDVLSQRIIQQNLSLHGGLNLIKQVVINEGFRGLYRGAAISAFTYSNSSAIWWITYSLTKRALQSSQWAASATGISEDQKMLGYQVASAASAAMTSAALTHPLDTIKTRVQTNNLKVAEAYRQVVQQEGYLALATKGLWARMMHSTPISVLVILGYETAKKLSIK